MSWTQVSYCYDGSFAGFLSCVFDSYANREAPASFSTPEEPQISLWPERQAATHLERAQRVYRSVAARISPQAQVLVRRGFLTCLPERELYLWNFLRLGYRQGARVTQDLTSDWVHGLTKAVYQLEHEAHMYKGFVRFSDQAGFLVAQIAPKNRVLPLLGPHFSARFPQETFVIYDQSHLEALIHQSGAWTITGAEDFQPGDPTQEELSYRRLWKRFYDTIAIEGRINPTLRRSHMPKRYWGLLTELQPEPDPQGLTSRTYMAYSSNVCRLSATKPNSV
ncbi:MAG: DNA metabolism protein [Oscillospiraceae bacterium]|nr:DNA metabolism protein [Oscillospiraceae bacterium]